MKDGLLDAIDLLAVADKIPRFAFLAFLPRGEDVKASGQLKR
jgi:hypothetical protein